MRNTEDKERAYALVVEQGFTATAAARELGIPRSTVCGWASDGHWTEIRGELCRDELRAKMKTAETELGDDSADVRETSMRILHGINLWLQMNGVVQPKEASALASALDTLNALCDGDGENPLAGIIFLPQERRGE